jgi:hypothetical protein
MGFVVPSPVRLATPVYDSFAGDYGLIQHEMQILGWPATPPTGFCTENKSPLTQKTTE